jgi:hypothetical protein
MEKELTDEEKKIAEKLHKDIKSEILSSTTDESVGNVVKRIVKLSKEGLNEEEIIEVVKVDLKPIAAATCTDRLDRYCGGGSDL